MQDKAVNPKALTDVEEQALRSQLEYSLPLLEVFVGKYLPDLGIREYMCEAYARQEPQTPLDIKEHLNSLLADVTTGYGNFNLDRVIAGGASLLRLAVLAAHVPSTVIPREIIPSKETIEVIMQLFHSGKAKAES